jgi:hypothetical protein
MKFLEYLKLLVATVLSLACLTLNGQGVPAATSECDLVLNTGATECGDEPMSLEYCPDIESTSCGVFCEEDPEGIQRCWKSEDYTWKDDCLTVVNSSAAGVHKFPVGPKVLRKGDLPHLICYEVLKCECSFDLLSHTYTCYQGSKCGEGKLLRLVRDSSDCAPPNNQPPIN